MENTITTGRDYNLSKTRKMVRLTKWDKTQLDVMERLLYLFEVHITSSIKISEKFIPNSKFIDSKEMLIWGPEVHEMINKDMKNNIVLTIPVIGYEGKWMCYVMSANTEQAFIDYEHPEYWEKLNYKIKYIYRV